MAYLGQGPFQEFSNPPTKDSFTGDGSTVVFDMDQEVPSGSQNALEVFVDNVRQEPGTGKAFILGVDGSGDHKRITFSTAPANGSAIYVINDKTNSTIVAPLSNDLNGTELILDVDGDTSITADTDDRIDFKIANVEHFSFSNSSGDTVIKPMVDAKDILFQQYDGRTLLDINDGGYIAIANGATGPGQLRLYEDTDNGTNYSAFQVGTQSGDITYTLPTADGSSGHALKTNGSGTLSWGEVSANTPTSANGQALGSTSLEWSDLYLADGGIIYLGDDQDTTLTHVADTGILLNSTRQLQFGDSGTYIHQSADGVLDLVSDTEIEINATTIDINGAVQISGTTTIAGNLIFGSATVTEAQLEILDGATVTTTELNIMDGGTSASSTTVADADRVVFNDGGTMKQVAVTDLAAYFDDEITSMPNLTTAAALVTVSALNSGSIATGFGNIDNGASNITSGGLVKLDVDADADDVTGDSATGRLTLGAGEDLNLYHGGTNSYIVNDTGDLILKTGASDEDMIFQGNDGGSAITALTLDMSAAGAATFNSTVTSTGFIIGSANIGEAELEILDGLAATTAELTIIDGNTSATSTTVADADRVVMNDNGTMVQVAVTDLAAYFDDEITAMPNLVTVGATQQLTTLAGIPFYSDSTSLYTHNVSGTDDTATHNTAIGFTAMDAITTGDNTTALGYGALGANTTGYNNTAVGSNALILNSTGNENVGIGSYSLDANTTGGLNTAIGHNSLGANSTASNNTAVGNSALKANTTAGDNVAVGYNAMLTNSTGNNNVAVGKDALKTNATTNNNTAVGNSALFTNVGSENTGLGGTSMYSNTTGNYNTAVGRSSMRDNTTASSNTAVGHNAMLLNTTGTRNLAIGANAYDASDTEDDNIAIGYNAMTTNTAGGVTNVAIGNYSLDALTSGDGNVGVGMETLSATNTGRYNTAVGYRTLYTNTSGDTNVAVGKESLYYNTTGDDNIALGNQALTSNTTGASNTAIGTNALTANTTADDNVAIGHNTLSANTTGTRNIAIGRAAYYGSDTESDNMAIGYNAMTTNTAGGTKNVAIGNYTLDALTSGDQNVGIGYTVMSGLSTGSANTAVGYQAFNGNPGSNGVAIGWNAGADVTGNDNTLVGVQAGNFDTAITGGTKNVCLGAYAHTSAAGAVAQFVVGYNVAGVGDNNFTFGNASTDSNIAYGATSISAPSDIRLKEDIQDEKIGLDFINDLRPVTFQWKKAKDIPEEMKTHVAGSDERVMNGKYNHGFIAQEVKSVIDKYDIKDGFSMWLEDEADGRQRIAEGELMSIMTKAIQELSAKNDALLARIETLEG